MISTLDKIIDIRQEFKSLFEYSLDFVFISDFEGRILDVNEVSLKGLEYSKEELLNMTLFDIIIDEERDQALEGLQFIKTKGRDKSYDIIKVKKKKMEDAFT